jgi:hypothetical protein
MTNWDSYLEPPDYPEGEVTLVREVACANEECAQYDVAISTDVNAYYVGDSASGEWKCETCGELNTSEFDLDAEDFGFDPDAAYERMRDGEW